MLNRIILIGRMTRDPELKYTPSGTAVTTFTLAVNRKFNKEETDFIDVVAWRKTAEFAANYGRKGRLVMIEGRLQIRTYETNEGQKRKVAEVVADDIKFLDKGTGQNSSNNGQRQDKNMDDQWESFSREVRFDDIDMVD